MKSLLTYIVLIISLIIFSFTYYPKFQKDGNEATISWDVSGYYWYLPATFIYKDLKELKFTDSLIKKTDCTPDNQQITELPNGKKVLKYSCGMAFQYLPYFLIAHSFAEPLGFESNGFSLPYQLSIHLGALIMIAIGFWFLRKILLKYYKDEVVAWVLFFLAIGTNYLNYATIDVGMTHAWLFSWYAILMYVTDLFYKKPTIAKSSLIGIILGVLMLTRPTEIIAVLIPLLWNISNINIEGIKNRIQFISSHFSKYIVAIFFTILIGSLQLFYWKYATGQWFVYSYGSQGFYWSKPYWHEFIFSFRCGWLLYCPFMILPYLGFVFLYKQKISFIPLVLYALFNLWIVTAWEIWWYGGRAMIQGYVVLAFPLASLISFVNNKRILQFIFYPIALFFVYLNIWWTHGVHLGGYLMSDNMTKAYYYKVFPNMKKNNLDKRYLDVKEGYDEVPIDTQTHLIKHFNNDTLDVVTENGFTYLKIPKKRAVYKSYTIHIDSTKSWVRFSGNIICKIQNWDEWKFASMGIKFYKNKQEIKNNSIKIDRLFHEQLENQIYVDASIKKLKFDSCVVYFNQYEDSNGEFWIKEISVSSFNEL